MVIYIENNRVLLLMTGLRKESYIAENTDCTLHFIML